MKRILLLSGFTLFFIAVKANAQAVEVSSFSYLNNLIHSDRSQIISLSAPVIMSVNDYDYVGSNSKIIYGNKMVLDGGMKYSGFKVGHGKHLNIIDLTMQNFCHYENSYSGRSIFLHEASLLATGMIDFMNNGAKEGGAIFVRNSTSSFNASVTNFKYNSAVSGGGAIYVKDSNIFFNSSTINFIGNSVTLSDGYNYGGAIFVNTSVVSFSNSTINFIDNNTLTDSNNSYGGAIYAARNTAIDFKNSTVNFINNNVSSMGGAIFVDGNSNIIFNDAIVNFTSNKAGLMGGDILANNSSRISFNNSEIKFTNNSVNLLGMYNDGGAIYLSKSILEFNNVTIDFRENSSPNGGCIFAVNSNMIVSGDSIKFINNEAGSKGGAIYMDGGVLNIETFDGKLTEFSGNMANNKSNAMYLTGSAVVNFNNQNGAVVNMFDAITSSYREAIININGAGEFNLSSREESIIPNLNINDRSKVNLGAGTPLQVAENLRIEHDAVFNIGNGGKDLVHIGNYTQNGTLKMDIFGGCMDERWGQSDQIIASGKVSLGENSKLNILENGDCRRKAYTLIMYDSLEGRFGSLLLAANHDIEYEYEGRWIVLLPKEEESLTAQGIAVLVSDEPEPSTLDLLPTDIPLNLGALGANPSALSGISCFSDGTSECDSLSLNQKELAETIENLSKSNKVQKHTDLYTALRILKYLEPAEKKEALEDTMGYFISNAIISQGMDRKTKGVYEHIDLSWNKKCTKIEEPKNEPFNNDKSYKYELLIGDTNSRKDKWSKGIWGEVQGQLIRMEEQENSPKKFEVNGGGVIVGFDVMAMEDIKVGVLGQFNRNWIKQDKNKGEMNNNGLGIYAGINKGRFDVKTMMLGSISEYEMTRVIRLGFPDEAKGKTSGINGNLDMEIGYKVLLCGGFQDRQACKLILRPYTGVTAMIVNTKGYKETGMYPMRLDVKENNYFKSLLRAGIGLTCERRSFKWDISAGVGYVAAGRKAKIESKVIDTDAQVPSGGVELGEVSIEGDLAVGYYIKKGLDIYANANVVRADNYRSLSGNIGVHIRF